MASLTPNLQLPRCPHCRIDKPHLPRGGQHVTVDHAGQNQRFWAVYKCLNCGGLVIAGGTADGQPVKEVYPEPTGAVSDALPDAARDYLSQALESVSAPAGAVMLAASAVDAMLKEKGYVQGTLNDRIDKAAEKHLITQEMARWAHQVRLDANEPRHADTRRPRPTTSDARRSCDFASALGDLLFVIPARVTRGLSDAQEEPQPATTSASSGSLRTGG